MFKKNKKDNGIMSELDNNPFMKQILFFGFYFVFFVVLILLLRTGYKNNNRQENRSNNSGYNYDYKLDRLNNQNYHFVYKEMVNGVATIYEGDISDGKMLFSKSGQVATTYFMRNDKFYVKDNNLLTWSETTNPLLFYKFTRPENLHSFIKKSTYVSKTDFIGVKKNDFTYSIDNNKLRKIFDLQAVEGDDTKSFLIVTVLENGVISSMTFDLTNYMKKSNENIKSYLLTFSFSKYDDVEEITSPIN